MRSREEPSQTISCRARDLHRFFGACLGAWHQGVAELAVVGREAGEDLLEGLPYQQGAHWMFRQGWQGGGGRVSCLLADVVGAAHLGHGIGISFSTSVLLVCY
jgi:hypothetical protein